MKMLSRALMGVRRGPMYSQTPVERFSRDHHYFCLQVGLSYRWNFLTKKKQKFNQFKTIFSCLQPRFPFKAGALKRGFSVHIKTCSLTLIASIFLQIQDYFVVLLSPSELDPSMEMILQVPIWAQRVIYIQGSVLKDADLVRAR